MWAKGLRPRNTTSIGKERERERERAIGEIAKEPRRVNGKKKSYKKKLSKIVDGKKQRKKTKEEKKKANF